MKRESRAKQTDRIHSQIVAGDTIRDLWLVYARARLTPHGIDIADESVRGTMELAFYAGIAAMYELMMRVSPDDVSEERGMAMLSRLNDELRAHAEALGGRQ